MENKIDIYASVAKLKDNSAGPETINTLEDYFEFLKTPVDAALLPYLQKFQLKWHSFSSVENEIKTKKPKLLPSLAAGIGALATFSKISFATAANNPLAILVPYSEFFTLPTPQLDEKAAYKASRFAFIRHNEGNKIMLYSPIAFSSIEIKNEEVLRIYYKLCTGATIASIREQFNNKFTGTEINTLFQLLIVAKIIDKVIPASSDLIEEETDIALRQWDFHDLLLHTESRFGRNRPVGGFYRFHGQIAPPDAIKKVRNEIKRIQLSYPSPYDYVYSNTGFEQVLKYRMSVRTQGAVPISADELGWFLYRTAAIVSRYSASGNEEFAKRPYPSGGARYENEFYITVDNCRGLERGFYYYDALNHQLVLLSEPDEQMENLLTEAWMTVGKLCRTQLLITISSRFQRFQYKYENMSYAAQLKDVGVIYAHMYLVATAMGLAPCALGAGNPDRFTKLAGTNYVEESSIGEFLLGSKIK